MQKMEKIFSGLAVDICLVVRVVKTECMSTVIFLINLLIDLYFVVVIVVVVMMSISSCHDLLRYSKCYSC